MCSKIRNKSTETENDTINIDKVLTRIEDKDNDSNHDDMKTNDDENQELNEDSHIYHRNNNQKIEHSTKL